MKCKIEKLVSQHEEAWIIKLPTKAVPDFVVLLAALHLGTTETILLVDQASDMAIGIYPQKTKKKGTEYGIKLNGEACSISGTSLEAIAAFMTGVAINGWTDTAHIDLEIDESRSLCFAVEPPV